MAEDIFRVSIVAFTERGMGLAKRIAEGLEARQDKRYLCAVSGPDRLTMECCSDAYGSLSGWTEHAFSWADALVFVSATGIAVRAIAPYVADKLADPAVVCIDEYGKNAIPLLSGHVGGANDLARLLQQLVSCNAAISTATDLNGVFAVDQWAREQGLAIIEREAAKAVSVALLSGEDVGFATDFPVEGTLPQGVVAAAAAAGAVDGAGTPARAIGFSVALGTQEQPFERTLRLIPKVVFAGVGCRRGADPAALAQAVDAALAQAGIDARAVRALASIDLKADELAIAQLAEERGWEAKFFSVEQLQEVEGEFSASDFVRETTGVDNVCERAAVLASAGGRLVVRKQAGEGVTVALAVAPFAVRFGKDAVAGEAGKAVAADAPGVIGEPEATAPAESAEPVNLAPADPARENGLLYAVGLGPGAGAGMTQQAREALQASDVIVGYTTYIKLIADEFPDKPTKSTSMRKEVDRCHMALAEAAQGQTVAMVCSGDAGVYGMAGLCLELAPEYPGVQVRVVPGVTAALAGAAVLGAPLTHDFAVISLSDLLTPWETIEARLDAAAKADFCIALYNPSSKKRADYLQRACDILLRHKAPETLCGTVRNIGREGEQGQTFTLGQLRDVQVDMFTTVFVGNAATRLVDGRLVTPRGYRIGGDA